MRERTTFERELANLGGREFQAAPAVTPATVGFEFDVHYGLLREVVADAGKSMPADGSLITLHTQPVEGFKVKLDGARLEINTKPFTVDTAGKAELTRTAGEIRKFARELFDGCDKASPKAISIPDVTGRPRPFTHPRTADPGLPIVKLPVGGKFTNCSVWASPQATITIPLSSVGKLVSRIRKSEGNGPGVAMTGSSKNRMGERSEALYRAKAAVDKMWSRLVNARPRLRLSDGTEVNRTTFTENLKGFLILIASYLWSGELRYQFTGSPPRDYERFGKAYLPLNVKAPFSAIRTTLLTPVERRMFDEVFAAPATRVRMFRLVRPRATAADGARKFLPPGRREGGVDTVHDRQRLEFGSIPTWNDLLDHTLNDSHNGWGSRLLVPLSNPIPLAATAPRVPLEMRRFGFTSVGSHRWTGMMNRVFAMVKELN